MILLSMKISNKIASLSFLAAFAFFTSGFCAFPMETAAASHMQMSDMGGTSGYENTQDGNQVDQGCPTCESTPKSINGCTISCGNSISKTGAIKKVNSSSELPVLAISHWDSVEYLSTGELSFFDSSPPDPSLLIEALLSVAKKE